MSDNVINLDNRRPHISAYVACLECGKDWIAVAPSDTLRFECPVCVKLSGVIVEPANPEFLNCFFRGARSKKENTKRTMVVLNAQRMIDEGAFRTLAELSSDSCAITKGQDDE